MLVGVTSCDFINGIFGNDTDDNTDEGNEPGDGTDDGTGEEGDSTDDNFEFSDDAAGASDAVKAYLV